MSGDVAVDAVLWAIFAVAIAFLSMGCALTARLRQPSREPLPVGETSFDHKLDRAA